MRTFRVNRMFPHVCARDEAAMFARIWQLAFFLRKRKAWTFVASSRQDASMETFVELSFDVVLENLKLGYLGGMKESPCNFIRRVWRKDLMLWYISVLWYLMSSLWAKESKMRNVGRRPLAKAGIHSRVDDDRIIKSQSFCGPRLAMNDGASFLWALLELNAISKVSAQFVRKQLRWFDRDSRARLTSVRSVGEKWWLRGPKRGKFSIQDDFESKFIVKCERLNWQIASSFVFTEF